MSEETTLTPEQEEAAPETEVGETPASGPDKEEQKPEVKPEGHRNPKLERRFQRLTSEIHTLKAQLAAKPVETEKPVTRPDINTAGMTQEAYIEQMATFKAQEIVDKERARNEQVRNQQEQQRLDRAFEAGKAKAQEKYPDFDEVLESSLGLELNGAVIAAIKSSPVVHDLRYLIASDPELEEKIANSSPIEAIRIIGKLETRFESSGTSRKVTAAPQPIKPVGGRASAGVVDPEKESPKEYAARRNRELSERNARPRR
jgi:hypothetical protein